METWDRGCFAVPAGSFVNRGSIGGNAGPAAEFASQSILRSGNHLACVVWWPWPRSTRGLAVYGNNDITDRKRDHEALQKTQAELAHVARVATMGELASSIAHEVNQPLAASRTAIEAYRGRLWASRSETAGLFLNSLYLQAKQTRERTRFNCLRH